MEEMEVRSAPSVAVIVANASSAGAQADAHLDKLGRVGNVILQPVV